jgi:hypothetical protein
MLIRQNGRSIYLTQTASQKSLLRGKSAEVPLGMKSGCAILLAIGFRPFYISLLHQPGVDHFLLESPLIAYFERRYFLLGD